MRRLKLILALAWVLAVTSTPAVADADVLVMNFSFTPADLTITPGETVTWHNTMGNHSTTSDDGFWDSGAMSAPWDFQFTFNDPGDFFYYCSVHGAPGGVGMSGVIHVVSPDP